MNTLNQLTMCKQMSSSFCKMLPTNYLFTNYIYIYIYDTYMYNQDLRLNNLQGLICHKTQPATNLVSMGQIDLFTNYLYHAGILDMI